MEGEYDDIVDFLESDEHVDSDWVNLETVDYDEMFADLRRSNILLKEGIYRRLTG